MVKYSPYYPVLYVVMNILYTYILKHIAIVDVFIIAIGFVLRIIIGGLSSNTDLSPWIILMTFLLALLLAFAKRRDDLNIKSEIGILVRKNTENYTLELLDIYFSLLAAITFVCYVMYTLSNDVINRFQSKNIYITSIFVLAGLLRYLQISLVYRKSGSPTKVLMNDRFIQICIGAWIGVFYYIIY